MSPALSRRQLLLGSLRPTPAPLRPPWTDEARIAQHCQRCDRCVEACPQGIIHTGGDGFPEIRFSAGECSFCGECAQACPAPIFAHLDTTPWQLRPVIGNGCLTTHGIYCRSCGDACPESAIRFRPAPGGHAAISIDQTTCTGCGACVSVCPRSVISMFDMQSAREAAHG